MEPELRRTLFTVAKGDNLLAAFQDAVKSGARTGYATSITVTDGRSYNIWPSYTLETVPTLIRIIQEDLAFDQLELVT